MIGSVGGKGSISTTKESGESSSRTSGSEATRQTTQRLDNASIASLTSLLQSVQDSITGKKEFTREAAIQDSEGIVKDLFTQFAETALPQIISKASQGGAYNSSAAKLLSDNLFAQTVGKAAEVRVNAISQYAQANAAKQQTAAQTLGTVLQGLLQAKETSTLDSMVNSVTSSRFKGKSQNTSYQLQASFGK